MGRDQIAQGQIRRQVIGRNQIGRNQIGRDRMGRDRIGRHEIARTGHRGGERAPRVQWEVGAAKRRCPRERTLRGAKLAVARSSPLQPNPSAGAKLAAPRGSPPEQNSPRREARRREARRGARLSAATEAFRRSKTLRRQYSPPGAKPSPRGKLAATTGTVGHATSPAQRGFPPSEAFRRANCSAVCGLPPRAIVRRRLCGLRRKSLRRKSLRRKSLRRKTRSSGPRSAPADDQPGTPGSGMVRPPRRGGVRPFRT